MSNLELQQLNLEEMNLQQVEHELERLLARKKQILKGQAINQARIACEISRKIVVIGGKGKLGNRFVHLFQSAGHHVDIVEKEDWSNAAALLERAELVLIAVPIHFTQSIIEQLPELSKNCVLADITSVKQMPINAMLKVHTGPVVGLHPMFGPDIEDFANQTIVVCEGRESEKANWLFDFLSNQRAKLRHVSAKSHDQTMAIVQVLRHFSTIAYGVHLEKEDGQLEDILAMSSPIYRLELAMVGRLFAQDPDLYTEIIFSNANNVQMMKRFIKRFETLLSLIEDGKKTDFKKAFLQTREWFGEYADKFLIESSEMLAAAHSINNK